MNVPHGARQLCGIRFQDVKLSMKKIPMTAILALILPVAAHSSDSSVLLDSDDTIALFLEEDCDIVPPGFVSANTYPWTQVLIDGERIGSTPLFRQELAAGEHTVTFVNDKKGVNYEEKITIEPSRTIKLQVMLQQAAGEKDLSFSPYDIARTDDEDCDELPLSEPAYLSVNTDPWAKVFVDNEYVGHSPLFEVPVSPGQHTLRFVRDDGTEKMNVFSQITANAGEVVKLQIMR